MISQQNRGKTLKTDKPKTAPLSYKSPLNTTPSLPVTQSYQQPHYYNDPASYPSTDYEQQIAHYGEQLISRGAPSKPSPPSTGTFHDLQMTGGYVRSKVDNEAYAHNIATKYEPFKDSTPTIFTSTATSLLTSYGNTEVSNNKNITDVFIVVVNY